MTPGRCEDHLGCAHPTPRTSTLLNYRVDRLDTSPGKLPESFKSADHDLAQLPCCLDWNVVYTTGTEHTVTGLDAGASYQVKVRTRYEGNQGSRWTDVMTGQAGQADAPTNSAATGQPTITGTAEVGETLTAATSGIADGNGTTNAVFTFQWIRSASGSDNDITDATSSTYVVTNADIDKAIKIRVSFTDDDGYSETLTSNATTSVPVPAPVIVPPEEPQIAQQASDAEATPVLNDWSLKPSGLGVGDEFRLIFLSSTKRNATSSNIGTYNTWIQGRAAAGHDGIQAYSDGFTVVGCTRAKDARDNTATTYTSTDKGVPIYWLNGNKVADDYEDFYDGDWDNESNSHDRNELGNNGTNTSQDTNYSLTGCDHDGTEKVQTTGSLTQYRALGNPFVRIGRLNSSVTGHGPLSGGANDEDDDNRPMYGLSAVFTVVDQLPPITLVSNTGQTLGTESSSIQSQPFTTGSNLGGYTLTSVDVGINGDNVRTRLFHIVPTQSNGRPDLSDPTKFITLTTPGSTTADKIHTFTAPAGTILAANTTYHLHLANSDGGNPGNIHRTSSNAEDDGGAPGWSIGNTRYWRNASSDPWSPNIASFVRMQINGLNALPSTDATLSGLDLVRTADGQSVSLNPAFAANRMTYTAAVANGVDEVTLTATTNHTGATIAITDDDDANTPNEADLDLIVGDNTLTVTVTAEDTSVTETYTITVTREQDPAEPVNVPIDWSLIPSGIGPGDQFRLLFLSGTRRDGSSSAITDYNVFVRGRAAAGHADIQAYSDRFMAVGCTEDVDAKDNTATTFTNSNKGVPIYWLNGNKVADEHEDFYDGDWDDESNDKNEDGNNGPNTSDSANYPLTGCSDDGTEKISGSVSSALGNGSEVTVARPNSTGAGHGPLSSGQKITETFTRPMYGLSTVFTVEDSSDATLSNIAIEGTADGQTVVLSPTFDDDTLTYTARVGNGIDEVTLTATKNDSNASVVITNDDNASTPNTADFDLIVGSNTLVITVTAMDTTTTLTYTITVTRTESGSAMLVPSDWSLVPSGLNAGDSFRLLFLSSTRHDASSASIDTYNDFVQGRAANGHTAIQAYSDGFTVVGCTAAIDARDNTSTTFTSSEKGIPIYWLNGNKVADDYQDFYDGDWDDEANDKNQSGNNGPDTSDNEYYPLTGCSDDGTEKSISGQSSALGSSAGVTVARPNSSDTGHGPLSSGFQLTAANTRPMYGISAVFTVTVTEPADCPTDTTWCATMGVRNTTTTTSIAKYEFSGYNITDSLGTLSSSTFSYKSTDYTITRLEQTTFTTLPANTISLRNFYLKAEPSLPANSILKLGDRSFTVGDESANPTAGQEEWDTIDNPLNWTNRQDVTVSLTLLAADATLSALTIEGATDGESFTLSPRFDEDTFTYTAYVANRFDAVTLTATKSDSNATVMITNDDDASTPDEADLDLNVGDNTLTVTVTAEDTTTTETYTITVTRAATISADAKLSDLTIEGTPGGQAVVLSPEFRANTVNYTASVANRIDAVILTATKTNSGATVAITGDNDTNTPTEADLDFSIGSNTLTVTVTAEDTTTTKTYTVTVTRAVAPPAPTDCPADATWCTTMGVGNSTSNQIAVKNDNSGYQAGSSFGDLHSATFSHGGTNYTVSGIYQFTTSTLNSNIIVSDTLNLETSPPLPDGTVLQLGSRTFDIDIDSVGFGVGNEFWDIQANPVSWTDGQHVTASLKLPGTATAPDPPTNLTATPDGANDINLEWHAPPTTAALSYRATRSSTLPTATPPGPTSRATPAMPAPSTPTPGSTPRRRGTTAYSPSTPSGPAPSRTSQTPPLTPQRRQPK